MIEIDLTGKTAIVTGGGTGIGRATISMLHRAGASVVVNYFRDDAGLNQQTAEELAATLGPRAIALQADVRNAGEIEGMFTAAIEHFGGVDIVINNAAVLRDRTIRNMSDGEWQSVIDTNLTGVFNVSRCAATRLRDGGRIISLASISGVIGFFGQSNYAAAKAGVVAMTKVLGLELARRKITVNAVAPGVVLTEMGKSIPEDKRKKMLEQIPMGRFAEPEELASVILFLASDLASYVTGQTLHVNGGWWAA